MARTTAPSMELLWLPLELEAARLRWGGLNASSCSRLASASRQRRSSARGEASAPTRAEVSCTASKRRVVSAFPEKKSLSLSKIRTDRSS